MSNIKFYPENVASYSGTALTVTDTESGYDKEFMLDRRLATYWMADDYSGVKNVDLNLGAQRSGQYTAIYAELDVDDTVEIYSDNNDNGSYVAVTQHGSTSTITSAGWQWIVIEFGSSVNKRYWRIAINPAGATSAPRVSTIFIGTIYEITVRYNYGCIIEEPDYSGVQVINSYGGQSGASRQEEPRNTWRFFYETFDSTNKGKLDSVLAAINGAQYPFIFLDASAVEHYVRWITTGLNAVETHDLLYNTGEILLKQELGSPA